MTNAAEVVIWSADPPATLFENLESADELAKRLMQFEWELDAILNDRATNPIRNIKLDRLLLTFMGLNKIREIQDKGYKVFADAKIVEIPDKTIYTAMLHLAEKPWMLNVMAGIASTGLLEHDDPKKIDALKRFADLCHDAGTLPCAVTVLTSKDPTLVEIEFNKRTPVDQVLTYVEMLRGAGFSHVVCSPHEAAAIRSDHSFDALQLVTPGIRMPGTPADDQSRTMTPAEAMAAGSDYLVIGRNLTVGDLRENFAAIDDNLNTATF
jgi:orotidine-5'-phosphate decarboxylase